ncbi:MAG: DUF4265 domain-containing protein [Flavobacteriales bacterium]|nr:DUF4265 domain-containing protein [Flavobacteriales bacterium]MBK7484522.1 DUF4265 domain-containing protein [Flavobacteriales bacterium]
MITKQEVISLNFILDVHEGWPPVAVESIPSKSVSGGFEVLDAPLYVQGLSRGDVVRIDVGNSDEVIRWSHIVRSQHSTVWLLRLNTPNNIEDVLAKVRDLSCSTVSLPSQGSYAIDVPGDVKLERVEALLENLDSATVAVAYPSLRHVE